MVIAFSSCKKNNGASPSIIGKWTIVSYSDSAVYYGKKYTMQLNSDGTEFMTFNSNNTVNSYFHLNRDFAVNPPNGHYSSYLITPTLDTSKYIETNNMIIATTSSQYIDTVFITALTTNQLILRNPHIFGDSTTETIVFKR